ncbi:hypothetical protein D9M71_680850 [compost metagenome]
MALAIFSAFSNPRTLPSWSRPFLNRSVSLARALITRAPSPPNASVNLAPAAALVRSPNLPSSLARMSAIGISWPFCSVNFILSLSDAAPMFSKNDLYKPPASPPSMVLLSVPITANCSAISTPAVVASWPTSLNASLSCAPSVRKSCAASAVWPPSFSTHSLLPMASAEVLNRLYMVPT